MWFKPGWWKFEMHKSSLFQILQSLRQIGKMIHQLQVCDLEKTSLLACTSMTHSIWSKGGIFGLTLIKDSIRLFESTYQTFLHHHWMVLLCLKTCLCQNHHLKFSFLGIFYDETAFQSETYWASWQLEIVGFHQDFLLYPLWNYFHQQYKFAHFRQINLKNIIKS